MKRLSIVLGALVAFTLPGIAAEDPVGVRKALMQNVGSAAAVSVGMMRNEIPYSPVVGKAAIASINATAAAYADYFPEGSDMDERSTAHPRVWDDREGFLAELAKLQEAVATATEAAGKDGPADLAAFTGAIQPVLETCRGCHETYRVDQ